MLWLDNSSLADRRIPNSVILSDAEGTPKRRTEAEWKDPANISPAIQLQGISATDPFLSSVIQSRRK